MFFQYLQDSMVNAIHDDDIEKIDQLISDEYHITHESPICSNYLVYAIEYGHTEAALRLIEKGVGMNAAKDDCNNPLIRAAEMGNNEVLAAIVAKNVIPVTFQDFYQKTALDYAKEQGNEEAVKLLSIRTCAHHKGCPHTSLMRDSNSKE